MSKVVKKIMEDAEKERQKILEMAKIEEDKILKDAEKTSEEIIKRAEKEAQIRKEDEKNRKLSAVRIKIRKEILAKKREIIDELLKKALEKVIRDEGYSDRMKELLKNSVVTGEEEVIVSKNEKVLDDKWLKEFNKKEKTKLKLVKEGDFIGGFILKCGKIEVDCTLESLLQSKRTEIEINLNKILFE